MTSIVFDIFARDRASRTVRNVGDAARDAEARWSHFADSAKRAGLAVTAVAASGVYAGVEIAKTSVGIEQAYSQSMAQVQAATQASGTEMDKLSALAIKLGNKTVYSANDAADAMLELSKAGISTSDIMGGALSGTLTLAAAGGLDLADAATIGSNAMNAFNLSGKDTAKIAAALAGGANASSASVESLAMGLSQVGPGAVNAGLSLNDTIAVLSAFDQAGIKGSDAGTSLKTMLTRLVPTTNQARDAMKQYGLSFTDAQGRFLPMTAVAQELQDKLGGLSQKQRVLALNTIFGSDATRAATVLMTNGAKGVEKYKKATEDQNAAQRMAASRMSGTAGALEALSGSIETAELQLGQMLAPEVIRFSKIMTGQAIPAVQSLMTAFDEGGIDGAVKRTETLTDTQGELLPVLHDVEGALDDVQSILVHSVIPAFDGVAHMLPSFVQPLQLGADTLGFLADHAGTTKLVLEALGGYLLVFKTNMLISAAATRVGLGSLSSYATAAERAQMRTRALNTALSTAAGVGGMLAFSAGADQSNESISTLMQTFGGAATGFALGAGPWGALIGGVAGFAMSQFSHKTDDAAQSAEDAGPKFSDLASTIDDVTGATTKATRTMIYQDLAQNGVLTSLAQYGVEGRTAVDAILGQKSAQEQLTSALDRAQGAYERLQQQAQAARDAGAAAGQLEVNNQPHDGPSAAELFAQAKAIQDKADAQKKFLETIHGEIGNLHQQTAAQRAQNAAVNDYAALFRGSKIPKAVITRFQDAGTIPTTEKALANLLVQYHLTPKQIKTIVQVGDVDVSIARVKDIAAHLNAIDAITPDLTGYQRGLDVGVGGATRTAQQGANQLSNALSKGTAGARADLSRFGPSVTSGLGPAKAAASAGGRQVGLNLQAGVINGFAGTQARLSAQAAGAVRAAVASAKNAGDIHSPSRKMHDLVGKPLGEGIAAGLMSAKPKVDSTAAGLTSSAIDKAGAKAKEHGKIVLVHTAHEMQSIIAMQVGHLAEPMGNLLDEVLNGRGNTTLDHARDLVMGHLQITRDAVSKYKQLEAGAVSDLQGFQESVFTAQGKTRKDGSTAPVTIEDMLAFQRKQRTTAQRTDRDVSRLLNLGLSKDLIAQLRSQGASGLAQIHTLAQASPEQIALENRLNAQTKAAYTSAGAAIGDAQYGAQLDQAKAEERMAERLAKEFRAAFAHIKLEAEVSIRGGDLSVLLKNNERNKGRVAAANGRGS